MTNNCRFSKLFGKCLPSRKGKGDPPVVNTHEDDLAKGGAKEDATESPKVSAMPSEETKLTSNESDPVASDDAVAPPQVDSEEKDPVSVSEEAAKAAVASSEVVKEGEPMETVDPQEEDSMWEVSCCGVDMPLSK